MSLAGSCVEPFPPEPAFAPASVLMDAYGDGTVAGVRAKYETRYSARFDAEARRLMKEEMRLRTARRFAAGRCVERHEVALMDSLFVRTYAGAPFLLASCDVERAPTRTRPRSWGVYRSRLHAAAGDDGLVRLHAAEFEATRRHAFCIVKRSTFTWTFHAQTRLHQRTPGRVRADREIGEAILRHAAVLHVACEPSLGFGAPMRLAVPCHEGLLCGKLAPVAPDFHGCDFTVSDIDGFLSASLPQSERAVGTTFGFVGLTYLGPDEMGDDRRELRDRMAEVADGFAGVSLEMKERFTGRDHGCVGIRGRLRDKDAIAAQKTMVQDRLPARAARSLRDLFSDERMVKAMGGARPGT